MLTFLAVLSLALTFLAFAFALSFPLLVRAFSPFASATEEHLPRTPISTSIAFLLAFLFSFALLPSLLDPVNFHWSRTVRVI